MITIIYCFIVLLATTLGACAGIGGGIIIKPFMDFLNYDNVATISFYSANAVFAMACFSSIKRLCKNHDFNLKLILIIAITSIIGGLIGNLTFNYCLKIFSTQSVKAVQSFSLCLLMLFILSFYIFKFKSLHIKNFALISLIGLILGFISSFLSIGGGPANVAVYSWLFGFDLKISVTYSLATILFAQGAQLTQTALSVGYASFNYVMLFFIIPSAILGGVLGSAIYKKIKETQIKYILITTMSFIFALNVYNLITVLSIL